MKPKMDENKTAGSKFGCVNMFGTAGENSHRDRKQRSQRGREYALVAEREFLPPLQRGCKKNLTQAKARLKPMLSCPFGAQIFPNHKIFVDSASSFS
jgi:hypothetical protein